MKLSYVLLLVLTVVASLSLVWWKHGGTAEDAVPPGARTSVEEARAPDLVAAPDPPATDRVPESAVQESQAPEPRAPIAAASVESKPSANDCRILGRLLDDRGAPIIDVRVVADAVEGPWARGVAPHTIEIHGEETEGYTAVSDASGRFAIDAPTPTSDWVSVFVEPDEFHGVLARDFGPAGGRNEPRLVRGDNQLGDLALVGTGAIQGTVRGRNGEPVGEAEVSLHGAYPGGQVVGTKAGADGSFRLGHVPPGTVRIEIVAERWLAAQSGSIEVRARAVSPGAEIVLDRAPSIAGLVVDEGGKAVAGVRIWAWPVNSGRGAGAESRDDGSFEMFLPQDEPYRFDFDHRGFEHYGGFTSTPVPPNTADLRIVLRRGVPMTALVLDAESGEPVVRFGLRPQVLVADGWQTGEGAEPVRLADHAQGECTFPRPNGKVVLLVEAPDHAPQAAPLAEDASGSAHQTIRLARGASFAGRAVKAGAAVPGARAILERCSTKIDASQPDEAPEERFFSDNYRFDLSEYVGRRREVETSADGRFRFADLAAGTYALTIRGPGSAPVVREGIAVAAAASIDAGDLDLRPGAGIRGRLVLPPGTSPVGWEVTVQGASEELRGRQRGVGADGSFAFEGLAPGRHTLLVQTPRDEQTEPVKDVDLRGGETVDVELDVAAMIPADLRVRVLRDGRGLAGATVDARCGAGEERRQHRSDAPTDAEGATRLVVRGCGGLELEALSSAGLRIGRSSAPITIAPGGSMDASVDVVAEAVTLSFPEGFEVPASGIAYVIFRTPGSSDSEGTQLLNLSTPDAGIAMGLPWRSRVVEIGLVGVGAYDVTVNASRKEAGPEGSGTSGVLQPIGDFRAHLEVVRGTPAMCALAAVDRR